MKLLIDDADIQKIRAIYDKYAVDGVTTNPSILAKCGRPPYEVLKEIRSFIGYNHELHAQVLSLNADDMVKEAHQMIDVLGKNTYIKIPTIPEGLKAMKLLAAEEIKTTATVIYTPMQAYLAAKAGANYAAPYVNRIDNLGADGIDFTKTFQNIIKTNNFKTQILAASFKNSKQMQELCEYGVGAATAAPEVIEGLMKNASVTAAVEEFVRDFEALCGKGKTMLNCN
ncbi:MAG: fructose-6-phosphate aldolase [Clostridia bacterium]|nr:fructose-6-phosphate aldolase [Clostridia bacterium]